MDPCPFVRIVIGDLGVKFPAASKTPASFYCKIKLKNFPTQFSSVPLILHENHPFDNQIHACFNFNKSELENFVEKSKKNCCLKIDIYAGTRGSSCGLSNGKLLGSVSLPIDVKGVDNRGSVVQNGWFVIKGGSCKSELHLNVRAEPDPRFVFQFDGEPECSPQVFQVNGNVKQAVFTCKFGFRNSGERTLRSRSSNSEESTSTSCLSSIRAKKEKTIKERKGWSVTIHDLSGSPVATASMVTPFVPSPGTDRVSRSNPGAWLILRPSQGTWKPWGRLEAWREGAGGDRLGYRFELLPDATTCGNDAVTLADSTVSTKNGGKFTIDITTGSSPMTSASSSWDLGSGSGYGSDYERSGSGSFAQLLYRGFVMSSTVEGGGSCSKPEVEVGVPHVTCTEDAAAFVALAAAMDLSMDACRLFSRKLRKELRQQGQEYVV